MTTQPADHEPENQIVFAVTSETSATVTRAKPDTTEEQQ